jgi:hypothetical protein
MVSAQVYGNRTPTRRKSPYAGGILLDPGALSLASESPNYLLTKALGSRMASPIREWHVWAPNAESDGKALCMCGSRWLKASVPPVSAVGRSALGCLWRRGG